MSIAAKSWSVSSRVSIRSLNLFTVCLRCRRRFSDRLLVRENDIVLLRKKGDSSGVPILTKPLQYNGKIQTARGAINQASLIGKKIRDVVATNQNVEYRIHQPTMAEYVTLSPRNVTPVYPADANLIVSLLDLHPPKNSGSAETDERLEIFEAGTGHGALTLHLARAIHGFNPPAPPLPSELPSQQSKDFLLEEIENDDPDEDDNLVEKLDEVLAHSLVKEVYEAYLPTRRAVIHTLDNAPAHTLHAQSVVRNFRHGLYYPSIDFHSGTIPSYLSRRLAARPNSAPFLEHAMLDLPSAHSYLEIVAQALRPNGSVMVFCPSITQINKCVQLVRERQMPFLLETVLELGAGGGVGGREWDVRVVKPRALVKAEAEARKMRDEGNSNGEGESTVMPSEMEDSESTSGGEDSGVAGLEMVCRPKVGGRVSGGGFLGLWRRMETFRRDTPAPKGMPSD